MKRIFFSLLLLLVLSAHSLSQPQIKTNGDRFLVKTCLMPPIIRKYGV